MRYAFFGDIHGNLEALNAVFAAVEELNVDTTVCLGDIVGYGADPEACVARVREAGSLCVSGNHDHAAVGALDITYFNSFAREAAIWTQTQLSDETKQWLVDQPYVRTIDEAITIVHGSLFQPEQFNYVQTLKDAEYNFKAMKTPLLFLGHSHQPLAFFDTRPMTYTLDHEIHLNAQIKSIVNIGSVGQPRDDDPRAGFALYDSEAGRVVIHRVEYDVDAAAQKIMHVGLPDALAARLKYGR